MEIRWPYDHISITRFPRLVRQHPYIEWGPWSNICSKMVKRRSLSLLWACDISGKPSRIWAIMTLFFSKIFLMDTHSLLGNIRNRVSIASLKFSTANNMFSYIISHEYLHKKIKLDIILYAQITIAGSHMALRNWLWYHQARFHIL